MTQSLPRTRSVAALVALAVVAALAVLVPTGTASAAGASTTSSTTLRIPADGGVTLAATLTGASPMTARPTVVEFTPYGTSGKSYDVDDDFNYLLVQIRGTGDSDGSFDALGPETQKDVANTLQWACGQSWSNGSLAVAGFSASAIMIFNSLHENLPCVKAAVLRSGTFELYRDLLVPGGIPNSVPGLAVLGMIGAPALQEGPQRMSRNPLSALTTILGLAKAGLNAGLLHPRLDTFWQQRGFRGDVNKIPTLFVDGAFDVEPRGDYMGFRQLQSEGADPHLLVVGGHDGAPAGTDNGVAEINKWFDHYLRGVDNGVQAEPAVQMLLANGSRESMLKGDFVRYDTSTWPAPDTQWTSLALSPAKSGAAKSLNDGSLSLTTPATVTKQRYAAFTSLPTNSDPNTIASTAAVIARQPSATQTAGCGRRERLGTRQFHPSGPLPGERLRWRLVPPLDPHDELKQLDATLSSIEAVLDVLRSAPLRGAHAVTPGNQMPISRSALSTESEPCTRFCSTAVGHWRPRSPRMVPGGAVVGSVAPASERNPSITLSPPATTASVGPLSMNSTSGP